MNHEAERSVAEGVIKLNAGCAAEYLGQHLATAPDLKVQADELLRTAEIGATHARQLPSDGTLSAALFAFEQVAASIRAGELQRAAEFAPELRILGAQLQQALQAGFDRARVLEEVRAELSSDEVMEAPAGERRKRMTRQQAEAIARENYRTLRDSDNRSQWARVVGCDPRTVERLPAWEEAAEWRRAGRQRLRRAVRTGLAEAIVSGDKALIASLSDEERQQYDAMDESERAKLRRALQQAAE